MFILSYVLGNKFFFDVFIKRIMARFVQISFKLHEHVVCSLFEWSTYFIKPFKQQGTKHIDQGPLDKRV